jgi:hypothetical protein
LQGSLRRGVKQQQEHRKQTLSSIKKSLQNQHQQHGQLKGGVADGSDANKLATLVSQLKKGQDGEMRRTKEENRKLHEQMVRAC